MSAICLESLKSPVQVGLNLSHWTSVVSLKCTIVKEAYCLNDISVSLYALSVGQSNLNGNPEKVLLP